VDALVTVPLTVGGEVDRRYTAVERPQPAPYSVSWGIPGVAPTVVPDLAQAMLAAADIRSMFTTAYRHLVTITGADGRDVAYTDLDMRRALRRRETAAWNARHLGGPYRTCPPS